MERFGLTRAGLGVVPHRLRHQGAAEDYERITKQMPPIAGGALVDQALDLRARQEIAERLGHGRVQITNVYLGPRRVASIVQGQQAPREKDVVQSAGPLVQWLGVVNQPLCEERDPLCRCLEATVQGR